MTALNFQRWRIITLMLLSLVLGLAWHCFGADLSLIQPSNRVVNTYPVMLFNAPQYSAQVMDVAVASIESESTPQQFSLLNYYPGWYFATQIQANTFSFPYRGQWPIGSFPAFVVLTNAIPQDISSGAITATFRVMATEDAVFRFGGQGSWNTGPTPPHARLFFSARLGYNAEDGCPKCSWYSADGWQPISNGVFTVTASLDPLRWTDSGAALNGTPPPVTTFQEAITNVIEAGICFGGGSFYDIGVGMTEGQATFEMLSLDFLPGTGALSLNLTNGLNCIQTSTNLPNWTPLTQRVGPGTVRFPVGVEPYRFWRATAL